MTKLISIIMSLALVIATTTAPAISQAMPHDAGKAIRAAETATAQGHDCHGEAKAGVHKTVQNDQDGCGTCCDKGMCKCVGGNCHSFSKYFGNGGGLSSAPMPSHTAIEFADETSDSAITNRLTRPPRA